MTNIVKSNANYRVVNSKIRGLDVDVTRFRYNISPVETPNGSLKVFTMPDSESYVTGLLEAFMNGNQMVKGVEWEETGTTQITLLGSLASSPPSSDEKLRFNYIKT